MLTSSLSQQLLFLQMSFPASRSSLYNIYIIYIFLIAVQWNFFNVANRRSPLVHRRRRLKYLSATACRPFIFIFFFWKISTVHKKIHTVLLLFKTSKQSHRKLAFFCFFCFFGGGLETRYSFWTYKKCLFNFTRPTYLPRIRLSPQKIAASLEKVPTDCVKPWHSLEALLFLMLTLSFQVLPFNWFRENLTGQPFIRRGVIVITSATLRSHSPRLFEAVHVLPDILRWAVSPAFEEGCAPRKSRRHRPQPFGARILHSYHLQGVFQCSEDVSHVGSFRRFRVEAWPGNNRHGPYLFQ